MGYELFIGNYERVIGMGVYILLNGKYIHGTVTEYLYKSRNYVVELHKDGTSKKVDKVYLYAL